MVYKFTYTTKGTFFYIYKLKIVQVQKLFIFSRDRNHSIWRFFWRLLI